MITITFKSKPFFYEKEKSGRKPNTIRKLSSEDVRFDDIMDMVQGKEKYGLIRIILSGTPEFFERKITDISYFDEWFIISWDKNEVRE